MIISAGSQRPCHPAACSSGRGCDSFTSETGWIKDVIASNAAGSAGGAKNLVRQKFMSDGWNEYASTYDQTLACVSRIFCYDMISAMNFFQNQRILDIGCGTGSFERAVSDVIDSYNIPTPFYILAIDYSEGMLDHLRTKLLPRLFTLGIVPSRFELNTQEIDGESLEGIPDDSFDTAVSCFGIVLFPNRDKCFSNILRVLKRDGQLIFNVWEPTAKGIGFGIIDMVNAITQHLASNNPADPGFRPPEQPVKASQALMLEALSAAGFVRAAAFSTYHSTCFQSRDHLWDWLLRCSPRIGRPLAALAPGEAAALKLAVLDKLAPEQPGGEPRVVLTNHGVTYVARKP